jgi:uncharacterized membrane protein HdeD (DUF308 family)
MDMLFIPNWRAIALRGAFGVLFGMGAILWPGVTLAALVLVFGVYALLDGIVAVALGSRARAKDRAWLYWLEGLLGIALGLLALAWTGAVAIVFTMLVGVWALVTGALESAAAIRLRHDIPGEIFLGFAGAVSLALGAVLVLFPRTGSFVLIFLLGSYALFFGVAMLMLAMRLRDHERRKHSGPHAATT